MTDLALALFLLGMGVLGLKRPFLWVLLYLYVDIVMPQKVAWGFLANPALKISLLSFILAFAGWMLLDNKKGARFTVRQGLIVALLAICGLTTLTAQFQDSAWEKWDWVWKAMVFAAFLPLTLRTRLRIEAAVLVFVLSIGAIVIGGGLKTVTGGGGYGSLRLLVDSNSGIYEGSIISTAAICTVPLILFLGRRGTIFPPDKPVYLFAAGLIFACLLMPVGTSARTGLVCIAVLGVLMMRSVRHRALYAGLAGLAMLAAIPFLPASFTERMGTIAGYEQDASASTRVAVWEWTIDYAKKNPFGGGFDAYRSNSFTYEMPKVEGDENNRIISYSKVTDEARAYHSSYFEMLGEQGWIGLGVWLWLHLLGLWQMERIWRREKARGDDADPFARDLATALQQAQIVSLTGAAFVGIAYQPFCFVIIALQCGLWSWWKRTRSELARSGFAARPATTTPQTASA